MAAMPSESERDFDAVSLFFIRTPTGNLMPRRRDRDLSEEIAGDFLRMKTAPSPTLLCTVGHIRSGKSVTYGSHAGNLER